MTTKKLFKASLVLLAAIAVLGALTAARAWEAEQNPDALAEAPVNTWARVVQAETGGRDQPIFVYAPEIERFVAAAGMQHRGGVRPRHYDTEEFDLETCTWYNAYPPGMEEGRPVSGPVGDEYAHERAMHGRGGRQLFYRDGDHLRLGAGGQWHDGKLYGLYCYVPGGKIYAYKWREHTLVYDVKERTWTDLEAEPRDKARVWGSMAYDPVNEEILHAGGGDGSAEVSTWAYSIENNEWRQLEFGSEAMNELFAEAKGLRWQAKTLAGRCASRHQVAETEAEAEVDLTAEANKLAEAADELAASVEAATLAPNEQAAGEVAVQRLASAAAAVRAVGPRLGGDITPALIAEVRNAREIFERVADALSPLPPGRARSQIALDEKNEKIVLFGGDGLDRVLSDLWVYDCRTRTWEQRFPEVSPEPRAGHILAWLPKSERIVLAGGYSRTGLTQDIWAYDVAANRWTLLMQADPAQYQGPSVNARTVQVGAVNQDDVLVCLHGNDVWAAKIDPAATIDIPEEKTVEPGTYVFNPMSPATWEEAAEPDPDGMRRFIEDLPANQWTAFSFPMYAPGARNRWGTSAYDTDRHQFLFWGGGHATSKENDVAHFSIRGGFWTIGYNPDDPIERVYASQPTTLSFNDRPHVPMHAYKAYCYDPTVRMMIYPPFAYDPLARDWMPEHRYPGLQWRGVMHSLVESTPRGTVVYSNRGLYRLDAEAGEWKQLPWDGPQIRRIWCDGSAMCYDSKRDALWTADANSIVRYDFATGTSERIEVTKPEAIGNWLLWREQVYLPKADLILLMRRFEKPDGTLANIAWNPNDGKYYWVDLPFAIDGEQVQFDGRFGWHDALAYDPVLDLVLLNNSQARRVWALRFDHTALELEEVRDE